MAASLRGRETREQGKYSINPITNIVILSRDSILYLGIDFLLVKLYFK